MCFASASIPRPGAQIANLAEWKRHILERLRHQVSKAATRVLEGLIEELRSYPAPASKAPAATVPR